MIKIIIIEDDIFWLNGIVELISKEPDISIVGVASDRIETLKLMSGMSVDIVLMDINLNNNLTEGIYIAAEITDMYKTKIIMLTSYDAEELIIKSFKAGACNYILKSNFNGIVDLVRETACSCTPVEVLAKSYTELQKELYLKDLTCAERHIYSLFEEGYKLKEIENITKKSNYTIRNQICSILSKLHAKNMSQSKERKQIVNR